MKLRFTTASRKVYDFADVVNLRQYGPHTYEVTTRNLMPKYNEPSYDRTRIVEVRTLEVLSLLQ